MAKSKPGTQYFELIDDKSRKFWEITLHGSEVDVRYGRIGTSGQTKSKSFDSEADATAHAAKLIEQKTRKGYGPASAGLSAARIGFEEELAKNPHDAALLAVYSDWLVEQGDPRGEFMQVQLALEDENRTPKQRRDLQKREKELLKEHEEQWLGPLAPFLKGAASLNETYDDYGDYGDSPANFHYHFEQGILRYLKIDSLSVPMARTLRDWPDTAYLRDLTVEYIRDEGEGEFEPGPDVPTFDQDNVQFVSIYPLLGTPSFAGLRFLQIGPGINYDSFLQSPHVDCGLARCNCAAELVAKMPQLEELRLFCSDYDLEKIFASKTLKNLRSMWICNLGVDGADRRARARYEYALDVLAKNRAFANLTDLRFHPHHEEYHGAHYGGDHLPSFLPLDQVSELVNSKHLKNLTHLQIRLSIMGDEGCQAIVDSGILRRLKWLDLRHGCITDEGAKLLAACSDLTHLEHLDLSRNGLTKDGIDALRATGIKLRADAQQTDEELAEEAYLREGDFE